MDHKSEDLLQGEGQTVLNNQSDDSLLDENQSAIKDTKNNINVSQDTQLDHQTFQNSSNTEDVSTNNSFPKESIDDDAQDIEVNSEKTDSLTEKQSIASSGGENINNSVSDSLNVENAGSDTAKTESNELPMPEQNSKMLNTNIPDSRKELEDNKEICDEITVRENIATDVNVADELKTGTKIDEEITTGVKIANVSEDNENVDSDFSDESEKSEEIAHKDDSRVNESSESVIDKESPTSDDIRGDIDGEIFGDETKTNFNSQRTEEEDMNGVHDESERVEDDGSLNAENLPTETKQNETSMPTQTDEKTEPVEEWMDILGNSLLKKKILKPGEGRPSRPKSGDVVFLNIEGRLDDGTVVDKFESMSFILGDGDVIQAWDLAVALMEMGEICELVTDSKYAYGALGKDDVPGNATITYTLELIKKEPGLDLESMSIEERTQRGEAKRERGNHLFSRKEFHAAINSYTKALRILEHPASTHNVDPEILKNLNSSQIKCYNNLAACQLKIEAYDAAIKSSNKVLSNEPDNVKALFRIGKSYSCKGDCENAEPYLRKALSLDPQSKMLHRELAWVTRKMKQDNASQKEMYRRMMGVDKNTPKKKQNKWWRMPLVIGSIVAGTLAVLGAVYRSSQH